MLQDEDFDEIVGDFLVESREMIESMDLDLVALEERPEDTDLLNRIFRYIHTIKGTSDFLHFSTLTGLAHAMEDVLDPLRSGTLSLTPEIMDSILEGVDGIKTLLADIEGKREHTVDVSSLAGRLRSLAGREGKGESAAPPEPEIGERAPRDARERLPSVRAPESKRELPLPGEIPSGLSKEEYLEIFEDFLAEAEEKLSKVDRDIEALATPRKDTEHIERLFRHMHTIKGTSGFLRIGVLSELAGALESVLDGLRSGEAALASRVKDLVAEGVGKVKEMLAGAPSGRMADRAPELLARLEEATRSMKTQAGKRPVESEGSPPLPPAGDEKPALPPRPPSKTPEPPPEKDRPVPAREASSEATIRVDTRRLDELMNLVGEMVLGRNRLFQALRTAENKHELDAAMTALNDTADFIDLVTSDLQKAVIKTRMQPVGKIFNKFPRVVRDLAREKGKKVALEIKGAETELDKSVIDQISDPLVHLIRNAVDHGIETPEERERAGKPPMGTILLSARQEGNRIAIEVADDGRGLDMEKIREKAILRGLIAEAESLPEGEIQFLIFHPGFSTADTIDRTSGRGVGMDVVKNNIEKLGGFVDLESAPREGTRFVVRLPLTLAIIPVLMVRVGRETFALPSVSVIETVRVQPGEMKTIDGKEVINLRGKILPILRISDLFDLYVEPEEDRERQYVVVTGLAEKRIGLLTHGLIGQEEVVIKPLGDLFESTEGIAGATIRGDGRIVLILDFASLLKLSPAGRESPRLPEPRKVVPPAGAARKEAPPRKRDRLNILVVDDSATERKIVRKAVEAAGHRVFEASDGASALAKMREMNLDLVITDIEMEGMDGLSLAQKIRSFPKWKNLPVVALSSHGQIVDRIRGGEAGLDAYLVKPLDRDDLRETLRRFFRE